MKKIEFSNFQHILTLDRRTVAAIHYDQQSFDQVESDACSFASKCSESTRCVVRMNNEINRKLLQIKKL